MSLAYTSVGTGDPVLFLHGCPTFPDVLASIAQASVATHTVIQIALPGYGASAPLAGVFTVADIHAAIEATVVPLVGDRPVALVGFSSGAYHAMALAARGKLAPRRVISLGGLMTLTPATRDGFKQFAAALRPIDSSRPLSRRRIRTQCAQSPRGSTRRRPQISPVSSRRSSLPPISMPT